MKDSFEVVYTGLRRVIGSPQDYTKNRAENQFPQNFDLNIPVGETDQNPNRQEEQKLEGRISSLGLGENLSTHRVQALNRSSEKSPKIDIPEDRMYMPVSCLNTFTQDWVIKVKINKKYDLKTWNNAKGTGTLLNLDLMDKESTQIQATLYNEAALKWNEILKEGTIYTMKNG